MGTDNVISQNEELVPFMGLKIKKSDYDNFINQMNESKKETKEEVKPVNVLEDLLNKAKMLKNKKA
jgi:hypothetical protein